MRGKDWKKQHRRCRNSNSRPHVESNWHVSSPQVPNNTCKILGYYTEADYLVRVDSPLTVKDSYSLFFICSATVGKFLVRHLHWTEIWDPTDLQNSLLKMKVWFQYLCMDVYLLCFTINLQDSDMCLVLVVVEGSRDEASRAHADGWRQSEDSEAESWAKGSGIGAFPEETEVRAR